MLAALAGRVKYMVDTPEVIYGSLDAGDTLAAALRFCRASIVHDALGRGAAGAVASRFPLVHHQWPTILKLRCAAAACLQQTHCQQYLAATSAC